MNHIGPSVTNNSLIMRFTLQLGTDFQHPCRINWTTNIRIIIPCPINNYVTLCPPWAQIKILAVSKAAPDNFYGNISVKVPLKKKASTGVLTAHKQQGNKKPKHKGSQHSCVLFKESGMLECKYRSHSSEIIFEKVLTSGPSRKAWEEA